MRQLTILTFLLFLVHFAFGQKPNPDSLKTVIKKSTKTIKNNPKDFDAYMARAMAKLELENEQGARDDFSKAIELKPDNAKAYDGRGLANGGLSIDKDFKNSNVALNDYNKAIELDPNFAMAYNHRGWWKSLINDKEGACADWKKARELGSNASIMDIKRNCE